MRPSKRVVFSAIAIAILLVAVGAFFFKSPQENKNLEDVTVKLKWLHQSQFAGNYVAKEKGFYEKEGLNVSLQAFDFEDPTIESVVNGNSDFGITSANQLFLAKANGDPIKAIAVIYKISPDCAYSLAENNIMSPFDFVGKTIGIEPGVSGEVAYKIMMNRLGIDRSNITEVYIGYDATELLNGSTDVSFGYITNEPNQAIEAGKEVNIILFAEYGVGTYADVIFAREDTLADRPELVTKFLKATIEGWRYAIENEEEAIRMILKYSSNSPSHEKYMLKQSIPLINTGNDRIGVMKASEWENVQTIIIEEGLLEQKMDIESVYTNKFIEMVYSRESQK